MQIAHERIMHERPPEAAPSVSEFEGARADSRHWEGEQKPPKD